MTLMTYRPINSEPVDSRLGRFIPDDWSHVRKHPFKIGVIASSSVKVERTLQLPHWHKEHNQGKEGSCFPAGTFVRMADGSHKPIEDIKTLDRVLTAEGNTDLVLQTMVRFHSENLIKISMWGHSHLRMTSEHPILTKRGYVSSSNLKPGDFIAIPKYAPQDIKSLDTSVYLKESELITKNGQREFSSAQNRGRVSVQTKAMPKKIKLNDAVGRIFGLWLAEGSTSKSKVSWHFGGHERDTLAAELIELIKQEFKLEAGLQVRGNGALIVNIYGVDWAKLFERMMSLGAYDKHLPGPLASGSKEFLTGILEGWLAGDGHHRRGRDSGVTVSHNLAMTMFDIGNFLGRKPAIRVSKPSSNKHAKTRRLRWDIEFANNETYRIKEDKKYVWRRVRGIEEEEFAGFVFNMHVQGDNSYVAEGIGVHNCVGHGVAMERAITNTSQNKMLNIKGWKTRRYDPISIWNGAKIIDEWEDTNPGDSNGTSVNAAYRHIHKNGIVRVKRMIMKDNVPIPYGSYPPSKKDSIASYKWATTVDQIRIAIHNGVPVTIGVNWHRSFSNPEKSSGGNEYWIGVGDLGPIEGGHSVCIYGASDRRQAFRVKNNWLNYPLVWLPYKVVGDLLEQYGEAALVIDR